jgi:CRP-like cAMP-binding protein
MALPSAPLESGSLSRLGKSRRYRRDTALFEQGSPAEYVYIIESGYVKVSRVQGCGTRVVIGLRKAEAILGCGSALLSVPHCTRADSLTECHVRHVPANEFRSRVGTDPKLSRQLHLYQSRELEDIVTAMAALGGLSARRRLEMYLAQALPHPSPNPGAGATPCRIMPPIRRGDLANLIGTTPEHLSRLLKDLEEAGIIRREDGWLVVLDSAVLSHAFAPSALPPIDDGQRFP